MTDPRKRRGCWHELLAVLAIGVVGTMAGCRSFCALGEWAAQAPREVLAGLRMRGLAPCETTIRRILEAVDDAALLRAVSAVSAWLRNRGDRRPAARARVVIAVDGKAVR